jgi:hypothetical protein
LQVLQNGTVAFAGTAGQLFSISDSLSGTLMAVTDVAGLPILEVFDSDMVVAGSFGTNALVVSGSGIALGTNWIDPNRALFISGNTRYNGDIFSGTTNIVDLYYPRSNPSGFITGLAGTGSLATTAQLVATGNAAVAHANGIGTIISGNLTQTGVALIAYNLAISGGLETRIFQTGSAAVVHANGIGSIISGNLTQTGATLFARDTAISGGLESRIFATGAAAVAFASSYANNIGINLSGNLTLTGQTLFARDAAISGGLEARIFQTGAAAVSHSNGIGSILSGNLTQTGATLQGRINSLSGWAAPSLAAYLYRTGNQTVTGSTTILGNFTTLSGLYEPLKTISANYSILPTDSRVYCNNTSAITLTFPSTVTASGQKVNLKLINTGIVVLTGTAGQLFDGSPSYIIVGQWQTREVHAGNLNFYLW